MVSADTLYCRDNLGDPGLKENKERKPNEEEE